MIKNTIVKHNWLSFIKVKPKILEDLQAHILAGQFIDIKNIPAHIVEALHQDEVSFLIEKTYQVLGRLSDLRKSLENLSPSFENKDLWNERAFLKGFALSRLGNEKDAATWFEKLPTSFFARIQIEEALSKLNQGDFIQAETLFKKTLDNTTQLQDPYSLCTLFGGLTLSLIQQGSFREAEAYLKKRRNILKISPSPSLAFGTRLYEILLLLEKNDFEQAEALLSGSFNEASSKSINGFFLSHLNLRLHLAKNELSEAFLALEGIKETFRVQKIPEGVLDFRLEEIELQLRSKNIDQALVGLQKIQEDFLKMKNHFLNFRLSLLLAQAYHLQGQGSLAFKEINGAIQEAEKRVYKPSLSWALFHGAGIALASGHPVQAKLYLHRGERLASELGLRVRFSCFSYIREIIDEKQSRGESLLSLVRHQEIGPEMEYYLSSYSLLKNVSLKVFSRQGQEILAEPDLRRRLFQEPGLFWFQKEEVLLAHSEEGKMIFVPFSEKPALLSAFRLFWNGFQNNDPGFSLKDIHQTRLSCTYREELHLGATKMLVTRIRNLLTRSDLQLHYNRDSGLYSLRSQLSPYTLISDIELKASDEKKLDRSEEILGRIAIEPFVSTRSLCQQFSVTRQALHPFLKKLVLDKKIRLVRRGPVSGYILLSKR